MSILKYTMYVYLLAAIFFAYKAITTWNEDSDMHFLFTGLAVMTLIMFFVRLKFAKNFNNRRQQ